MHTRRLQTALAAVALLGMSSLGYAQDDRHHGSHTWESREVRAELSGQIEAAVCIWAGLTAANRLIKRRWGQSFV
ncbi:MAG: hypothetical protein WCL39_14995 [Armatimonadota bacterium]